MRFVLSLNKHNLRLASVSEETHCKLLALARFYCVLILAAKKSGTRPKVGAHGPKGKKWLARSESKFRVAQKASSPPPSRLRVVTVKRSPLGHNNQKAKHGRRSESKFGVGKNKVPPPPKFGVGKNKVPASSNKCKPSLFVLGGPPFWTHTSCQRALHLALTCNSQSKPGTKMVDPEPMNKNKKAAATISGWDCPD